MRQPVFIHHRIPIGDLQTAARRAVGRNRRHQQRLPNRRVEPEQLGIDRHQTVFRLQQLCPAVDRQRHQAQAQPAHKTLG